MPIVHQRICMFCGAELEAISDTMRCYLIKTLARNPASIELNAKGIWVQPPTPLQSISASDFRNRYTNTFCECHRELADQSINSATRDVRFDNISSRVDEERMLLSSLVSNPASYSRLNAIVDALDARRKDSHYNKARALSLYAPTA